MEGKVVLVTGASRPKGIGLEVCRQLAQRGHRVILTARDLHVARERAAELADSGGSVTPMAVDVADSQSVDLLASEVRDQFGVLDILINNAAGMSPYGEQALTADLDASRVVFETTLYGSWRMIQAFVPLLRLSSSGRIVNVTSGAGSHGDPYFGLTTNNGMGTSYAVSKAALNALTVKIANELADAKILVNAACPGFTATFEGGESMGARPVREGAAGIVWAAELAEDGPTGKFFRDGQPLAW